MFKFSVYVAVTILVIWTMDVVNVNQFFKKNADPVKAKVLLFMVDLSVIYLVTNFILDILYSIKII